MLPTGFVIGLIAALAGYLFNQILPETYKSPKNYQWFMQLRRPKWLTFEKWIPVIWISIFICGIISAAVTWDTQPGHWLLMGGYLVLEGLILAYMPILCGSRSLRAGAIIGATGWLWGCLLALNLASISHLSIYLLLPYLLWSPVGTYVTWEMIQLNPSQA